MVHALHGGAPRLGTTRGCGLALLASGGLDGVTRVGDRLVVPEGAQLAGAQTVGLAEGTVERRSHR